MATVTSEIPAEEEETGGSGSVATPRLLSASGGSGSTTKTLTVIGFNVTDQTKVIDGVTHKVIESYVSPNFNITGWETHWMAAETIIGLIQNPIRIPQDEREDVSPFTNSSGTVYERAYKTMLYVPSTWTQAFFQAHANDSFTPEAHADSYEYDGATFVRRGLMGKDSYVMVGYDSAATKLSSESKPTQVTDGALVGGGGLTPVLLTAATNVTVRSEEDSIHTVSDDARFLKDVNFLGRAYVGEEKTTSNKVATLGDVASEVGGIEALIPAQASAQNQLADKAFVNSSIATNTATFRGTYNLVADLSLTTSATEQQVAAAIAAKLAALSIAPENNDYCFVQVPTADATPELISRVDRYKCTVTESGGTTTRTWGYEWSLNNSSFTAAQWAAINSGITSALVAKLGALPTADELAASLLAKYEKPSTGIPKTDLSEGVQVSLDKADTALQNSGNQLLDGSISARNFLAATQLIVGTSSNGLIFSQDDSFVYATVKVGGSTISTYKFPKDSDYAGDNGNIARLLDVYAAVQQIAPAWVSGTAYTVNALVSYNGVVYRCKTDTVSPHIAKPNTDTTHWEAKKVSELFLPLTGGTMTGNLEFRDMSGYRHVWKFENGIGGDLSLDTYSSSNVKTGSIFIPAYVSGTLALLENLATEFSTSATYAVNDLCVYNSRLYRCTTAVTTAGDWTGSTNWTETTLQDILAAKQDALSAAQLANIAAVSGKADATITETVRTTTPPNLVKADVWVCENDGSIGLPDNSVSGLIWRSSASDPDGYWQLYPSGSTWVFIGRGNQPVLMASGADTDTSVSFTDSSTGTTYTFTRYGSVTDAEHANSKVVYSAGLAEQLSAIITLLDDKAAKVSGATSGNLASLDANGDLADSGKSAARVDNDAETAAFADIFRMDTELNVVANATPQDVAVAKLTELMGESLDTIYAAAQAA